MNLKNLFLLAVTVSVFSATNALASTQVLFSKDGKKVTVLLAAMGANPDAQSLYNSMNVPAEDSQGKLSKKILFTDADGVKAFAVLCAFSKVVPGVGSCTVVIQEARGALIEPASRHAAYSLQGSAAEQLVHLFNSQANSSEFYRSSDQHLTILGSSGGAAEFKVEYK